MNEVLSFLQDTEELEEFVSNDVKEALLDMVIQITECAHFIRKYAEDRNFCKPPLRSQSQK